MNGSGPDIFEAISADLDREQSTKRRHFTPALLIALGVVALLFGALGIRQDLFDQPLWRIATQGGLWLVCLILFPAIGIGLWFPSRALRIGIATVGGGLALVSALGWPPTSPTGDGGGPCAMMLLSVGAVFLGLGALSGAFGQRRASSSTFWVASGIALGALASITWMCPNDASDHVLGTHLAPAVGLAVVASLIGMALHKRLRRRGR